MGGKKALGAIWAIWGVFFLAFVVITGVGIEALNTPEAEQTIKLEVKQENNGAVTAFWDTRFLMRGYLNTHYGRRAINALDSVVFSKTKLIEFGYNHHNPKTGACCEDLKKIPTPQRSYYI